MIKELLYKTFSYKKEDSYNFILPHTQNNINSDEYKEMFELKKGQKLTSRGMQEYFRNKPRKDITKYSSGTRFKNGNVSCRKGTKARLQTLLERPIKYAKSEEKEL